MKSQRRIAVFSLGALALASLAAAPAALAGPAVRHTPEELEAFRAKEALNAAAERARKGGPDGVERGSIAPGRIGRASPPAGAPAGGKVGVATSPAARAFHSAGADGFEGASRFVTCVATAEGVRIFPIEGEAVRRDLEVGWRLASVRAGARTLLVGAPEPPALASAARVLYDRGAGFEERYDLLPEGIEQSFVLADMGLYGTGDDVAIEAEIATALQPRTERNGEIVFEKDGAAALVYGKAVAIDAAGRQLALATQLGAAGRLRIDVPGTWLASAAFPVTVDPLIGSRLTVANATNNERAVDVAYSAASDIYLVVWEFEYAADDNDIYGAFYRGDGTPLPGGVFAIDDTTADSIQPSVAWCPNGDTFLVAWADDGFSVLGINGTYDIGGALVTAAGAVGGYIDIYGSWSNQGLPHVGANETGFVVAWTLDYFLSFSQDYDAQAIEVSASGVPGSSLIDVASTSDNEYDCTVNRTGAGATPWLVNWSDATAGDYDIYMKTLSPGGLLGATQTVAFTIFDEFWPSVAGDGNEWCVGYVIDLGVSSITGASDWDVYAQRVNAAGKVGGVKMVALDLALEYDPAVAVHAPAGTALEYVVSYASQEVAPASIFFDRLDAATLANIEDDVRVSTTYAAQLPRAAARAGNAMPDYLVAWEAAFSSTDSDVFAQRLGVVAVPPDAQFAAGASGAQGQAPFTASFVDQSTGTITTWAWDFGDGGTSAVQSPTHVYANPGLYTVKLTVSGPAGSDSETKANFIAVYVTNGGTGAPAADFTGGPQLSGRAPLTVSFRDLSTGALSAWAWSFGDGASSSMQNPTHTYSAPGTYHVVLTVSGPQGTDTETKQGYVIVSAGSTQSGSSSGKTIRSGGGGGGGCAAAPAAAGQTGGLLPLVALVAALAGAQRRRPR